METPHSRERGGWPVASVDLLPGLLYLLPGLRYTLGRGRFSTPIQVVLFGGLFSGDRREGRGDRLERLAFVFFFVTLHSSLAFYLLPGFKGSKAGPGEGEAPLSCSLCCAHSPKGVCWLVCA